ncbi:MULTISPECIES: hypothetical protein [Gordonia]|uniref:Uncharacterized protein n=1 Tax=Gordonia terrae C-6 TaxID=1316928 RepID=R7YF28_9ACTN|nr:MULTISPECIES: hypothetical protein [Gordonia]EON34598.1 hypothetical protein GTC6_00045 [Gordonia terrae C-6]
MASDLAAAPAGMGLPGTSCSDRVVAMAAGGALGDRVHASPGLYFDQMEITTITQRRLGGNQWPVPAEDELPVTVWRR